MMPTLRTARGNRLGLAIVGVLLVAAGAAALVVGSGVVGHGDQHAALLTATETHWVRVRAWAWPAAAALAAVITLLCLRWLIVQLRTDGSAAVQLETDRRRGATVVDRRVLERAISEEIGGYPGVARVTALLAGRPVDPQLHLTVGLREGADLPALRARIDAEAVAHLCSALEVEPLPLLVTLRLDVAKAERV